MNISYQFSSHSERSTLIFAKTIPCPSSDTSMNHRFLHFIHISTSYASNLLLSPQPKVLYHSHQVNLFHSTYSLLAFTQAMHTILSLTTPPAINNPIFCAGVLDHTTCPQTPQNLSQQNLSSRRDEKKNFTSSALFFHRTS
jgi:hypothetical protein